MADEAQRGAVRRQTLQLTAATAAAAAAATQSLHITKPRQK